MFMNNGTGGFSTACQVKMAVAAWTVAGVLFFFCMPVMAQAPGGVTLVSPASQTTGVTPTLSWNEASGATWYKLYIKGTAKNYKFVQWYEIEDTSANYPEVNCSDGVCSVTLTTELPSDGYNWYVHGWNSDGNGDWSSGLAFTVLGNDQAPSAGSIVSPSNITKGAAPKLVWKEDPLATWYKLYLQTDATSAKLVRWYEVENNYNDYSEASCSDGKCSVILSDSLTLGDHTWYIMGWNQYGNGEWSKAALFDVTGQGVVATDTSDSGYIALAAGTDGETLLTTQDGTKSVYSLEGETAVVYASNGLPQKGEIDGTIVLFENYTSSKVDVAIIDSEGSVTYSRNQSLPQDTQNFLETPGKASRELSDTIFGSVQLGASSVSTFFSVLAGITAPDTVDLSLASQGTDSNLLSTINQAQNASDLSGTQDDVGAIACGWDTTGAVCVSNSVDNANTAETGFEENLDENRASVNSASSTLIFGVNDSGNNTGSGGGCDS